MYYDLVANSILVLAWATVFAGGGTPIPRGFVLLALCAIGLFVSVLWWRFIVRSNQFTASFYETAHTLELGIAPGLPAPFREANAVRNAFDWPFTWGSSGRVLTGIVLAFVPLYLVLGVVSLVILSAEGTGGWLSIIPAVLAVLAPRYVAAKPRLRDWQRRWTPRVVGGGLWLVALGCAVAVFGSLLDGTAFAQAASFGAGFTNLPNKLTVTGLGGATVGVVVLALGLGLARPRRRAATAP